LDLFVRYFKLVDDLDLDIQKEHPLYSLCFANYLKFLCVCSIEEFLVELKNAGLGSLPGTAAEVRTICRDVK